MKDYKGVIIIQCKVKTCIEKKKQIDHSCMSCVHRVAKIVDLKNKALFSFDKAVKKKQVKKEK